LALAAVSSPAISETAAFLQTTPTCLRIQEARSLRRNLFSSSEASEDGTIHWSEKVKPREFCPGELDLVETDVFCYKISESEDKLEYFAPFLYVVGLSEVELPGYFSTVDLYEKDAEQDRRIAKLEKKEAEQDRRIAKLEDEIAELRAMFEQR
jgi:hypothetical protein